MKKIIILTALTGLILMTFFAGCGSKKSAGEETSQWMTTLTGLQYRDVKVGDGETAVAGNEVEVHYTGWLYVNGQKGTKFDSSRDRNELFKFPLGRGRVIDGWDEGIQGMKIGGTRELLIPPRLGYGTRGAGAVIPPNATLFFEVELVNIVKK